MSQVGPGRAAAPITGLFALVLLLGPGRPVEPPEYYRVELEVPPVDAALWFAARYPQYFTSGEVGLEAWLDRLEPHERAFVVSLAQTLTWEWVEHELAQLDGQDPNTLALASTEVVRLETLNQLEIDLDLHEDIEEEQINAYTGDPYFGAGMFARLVRGVTNCAGQNSLVAVLLDNALQPSIEVEMAGVPKHVLVRLSGPELGQPVYVDAWSNLPPFAVLPWRRRVTPLLAELGDPPPPVVSGAASREPYPAEDYARSGGERVELQPGRWAARERVEQQIRAPALDQASLAKIHDLGQLYLFARILHIYDDPRAAELYHYMIEHHCVGLPRPWPFLCDAAELLSVRV